VLQQCRAATLLTGGGGGGASHWGDRRPGKYGGGGGGNHASRAHIADSGRGGDGFIVIEMFGRSDSSNDESDVTSPTLSGTTGQKVTKLMGRVWTLKNQLVLASSTIKNSVDVGLINQKLYTGSTVFKPSSSAVSQIRVTVTGGGAGGGGHNGDDAQGGGGAGGTCIKTLQVSDLPSGGVSITVGGGGAAATNDCHNCGGNGADSKFGAYCNGGGGKHVPTWGIGGLGGAATNGDVNLIGGTGHTVGAPVYAMLLHLHACA
jgi:hypothetical protein